MDALFNLSRAVPSSFGVRPAPQDCHHRADDTEGRRRDEDEITWERDGVDSERDDRKRHGGRKDEIVARQPAEESAAATLDPAWVNAAAAEVGSPGRHREPAYRARHAARRRVGKDSTTVAGAIAALGRRVASRQVPVSYHARRNRNADQTARSTCEDGSEERDEQSATGMGAPALKGALHGSSSQYWTTVDSLAETRHRSVRALSQSATTAATSTFNG